MRFALVLVAMSLLGYCKDETVSGHGGATATWVLRSIDGAAFPARATLTFPEEGRLAGEAPCNRYSGQQTVPYPWFSAGHIIGTKRACPDLDAETRYFRALGDMTLAEIAGDTLILSNDAGREMVFRAAE
ncbi:META domain-containing protein [Roseovarius ramblicola]|uniref:META domain-containing protein n=1 Tax=Roseovarius ramblicola TaxID=2022336 RepID=A0ABV5I452_9RHOB